MTFVSVSNLIFTLAKATRLRRVTGKVWKGLISYFGRAETNKAFCTSTVNDVYLGLTVNEDVLTWKVRRCSCKT